MANDTWASGHILCFEQSGTPDILARINKLPKILDRLLCILPFEEELHNKAGTSTKYIGNPSMWLMSQTQDIDKFKAYEHLGLDIDRPVVGIFPGSRSREIDFMMPVYTQAIQESHEINANIQFILVKSHSIDSQQITKYISGENIIITSQDSSYLVQLCADIVWAKSGTNSLESCCAGTPTIIGYKEWKIFWKVFEYIRYKEITKYIGLPNIIAGYEICPELTQDKCTPENYIKITQSWLNNPDKLKSKKQELKDKLINKLTSSQEPFYQVAKEIIYTNQVAHSSIINKIYISERAKENSQVTSKRKSTRPKYIQ